MHPQAARGAAPCSNTAEGRGALAWAAQIHAEGPGGAVGHGEGAVGCCWSRKPPERLTWGPPAPPATPACRLLPRLLPPRSPVTTFRCQTRAGREQALQ